MKKAVILTLAIAAAVSLSACDTPSNGSGTSSLNRPYVSGSDLTPASGSDIVPSTSSDIYFDLYKEQEEAQPEEEIEDAQPEESVEEPSGEAEIVADDPGEAEGGETDITTETQEESEEGENEI